MFLIKLLLLLHYIVYSIDNVFEFDINGNNIIAIAVNAPKNFNLNKTNITNIIESNSYIFYFINFFKRNLT